MLPKGIQSRKQLKNWRPISLLNVSYKIASLCIANRLKMVLPKLIHPDQSGFLKGRYIMDTIRTVYDAMSYAEDNSMSGLLLLVDFQKAFDTLSKDFISRVLDFGGFGKEFVHWCKIFSNNLHHV